MLGTIFSEGGRKVQNAKPIGDSAGAAIPDMARVGPEDAWLFLVRGPDGDVDAPFAIVIRAPHEVPAGKCDPALLAQDDPCVALRFRFNSLSGT